MQLPRADNDPRDEAAFVPFTLRTSEQLAEANGTAAENTSLPLMLPLLCLFCMFFFPGALMGIGFMGLRSLGSDIAVSSAASSAFMCVHFTPDGGTLQWQT